MPVSHLYVFFGKMSIHVFCPLFNFFIFRCMNCLYALYINPFLIMLLLLLSQVSRVQLLSLANISSNPLVVFLLMASFAMQNLLGLIRFSLFIFTFTSFVLRKQIKKKKSYNLCQSVLPLYSFWSFMVLSPTFSF